MLAALMGVLIPMTMLKFGRDPAVGSSVLITAVTDSGGFFIFLGLATLFLRLNEARADIPLPPRDSVGVTAAVGGMTRRSRANDDQAATRPPSRRDSDPMRPRDAAASDDAAGLPHPDLVAAIPRLRRYARVLTGEPSRADDLVQDTLARAWEKRAAVAGGHAICAHGCSRSCTTSTSTSSRSRGAKPPTCRSTPIATAARRGSCRYAANQLDRVELLELVAQMGRLPAEQREVLLLAAVEELRYEEIAGGARRSRSGR